MFSFKKQGKPCLGFLGLYNILIITELIMSLLWPLYITYFIDKTDHFVIPGTDTED